MVPGDLATQEAPRREDCAGEGDQSGLPPRGPKWAPQSKALKLEGLFRIHLHTRHWSARVAGLWMGRWPGAAQTWLVVWAPLPQSLRIPWNSSNAAPILSFLPPPALPSQPLKLPASFVQLLAFLSDSAPSRCPSFSFTSPLSSPVSPPDPACWHMCAYAYVCMFPRVLEGEAPAARKSPVLHMNPD